MKKIIGDENHKDSSWVDDYINEVGSYSTEHIGYIGKFKDLLDKMNQAEGGRRFFQSFRQTVADFEKYAERNKIVLTPRENSRLSVIISSGLNGAAKKRMAEDLIHSIRERHEQEKEQAKEEERREKEIGELRKSPVGIINWLRLTRFALEFGTITLFSHRLKSSSLNLVRVHGLGWFQAVENEILGILNDLYHYLSILEYNSLVKFSELGRRMQALAEIQAVSSYPASAMADEMDSFARNYIILVSNLSYLDRGLKKIYRERKAPHGFWGHVGSLTGRPVANNKYVNYSPFEKMNKTISGVLLSYYTIRYRMPVRTVNQVMYLLSEDGLLNSRVKHLTEAALHKIETEDSRAEEDVSKSRARFEEISSIAGKFLDRGEKLSERMFQIAGRSNIKAWEKESEIKPFFRLGKIIDAYNGYLLDVIADSQLKLEYDDELHENYFEKFPELMKAVDNYRKSVREMEGSRGRDIFGLRLPEHEETEKFIERLIDREAPLPQISGARDTRDSLNELSAGCYNLCLRFNDAVNRFTGKGKTMEAAIDERYDFYLNAQLVHPRYNSISFVLNRKEVTLADMIEAGCSVAVYIADFLGHHGIEAIKSEAEQLKQELEEAAPAKKENDLSAGSINSPESEMLDELGRIYRDSLTGLFNARYLEDVILHEEYDDTGKFQGNSLRHLFCCSIVNLADINRRSGNEAGDRALVRLASLIREKLEEKGGRAVRYDGTLICGFLEGLLLTECADLLKGIISGLLHGPPGTEPVPEGVVNFGIYREWKGAVLHETIDIARQVMLAGVDGRESGVAFPRNQDQVLHAKDFDRKGAMGGELISLVK